jgi:hypothetical protein
MTTEVFSLQWLGIPVTVEDLSEHLSLEVLSLMLSAECKSKTHAKKILAQRTLDERKKLSAHAERLWQATRLDKEELEQLAVKQRIPVNKRMKKDYIAHLLIEQIGEQAATALIEEALRPGETQRTGIFSSYQTPPIDLTALDMLKFISQMEAGIQNRLSSGRDGRRVKVKAHYSLGHLFVHVFFERPDTDGREITDNKELLLRNYERGAGFTFFRIVAKDTGALLLLRAPQSTMGSWIRETVGGVLWHNTSAVPMIPVSLYDLNILLNPSFRPNPITVSGTDVHVSGVRLQFIEVLTSTGNLVKVSALQGSHDALRDFHALSKGAAMLANGCEVRLVELKFDCEQVGTRKRVITVQLRPNSIKLDEQYFLLVEAHLRAWGISPESPRNP